MFTTALSPTGTEPATHWISSGLIESEFADLLPLGSTPGQPEVVHILAQQAGMFVSIDDITGLLAAVDVSEEPPAEALGRARPRHVHGYDPMTGFIVTASTPEVVALAEMRKADG